MIDVLKEAKERMVPKEKTVMLRDLMDSLNNKVNHIVKVPKE